MSFFAVLFALLIEQVKPLPRDNPVHHALVAWVGWTGRTFDAGKPRHAWVVWCVGVLLPSLIVCALWWGVNHWSRMAGLALMVALLYLTLGFRQFSHFFTDIREALTRGDEARARRLLAEWRHLDASELPRTDLLRHVIEHSLLAAHRHVFGVFFWFVVLAAFGLGPAGAVFYRMAEFASRYWGYRHRALDAPANEGLLAVAQQAFNRIDHVPAGSRPSASPSSATSRRRWPAGAATPHSGGMPTKASSWPLPPVPWGCSSAAPRRRV
jgi:adenosylcobinamide-phosphate synthase